jgi:hypothetical protein
MGAVKNYYHDEICNSEEPDFGDEELHQTAYQRAAWSDARLCYLYCQLEAIAEQMVEDSGEENCLRHAMSKIDEADMIIRQRVKDRDQ